MFLPAKQYVRKLIPTTVITGVRFQRLMAVPNTGRTVPVNAKRLITTTAETGLNFLIHTAAKAIMPTVRQNVKLLDLSRIRQQQNSFGLCGLCDTGRRTRTGHERCFRPAMVFGKSRL